MRKWSPLRHLVDHSEKVCWLLDIDVWKGGPLTSARRQGKTPSGWAFPSPLCMGRLPYLLSFSRSGSWPSWILAFHLPPGFAWPYTATYKLNFEITGACKMWRIHHGWLQLWAWMLWKSLCLCGGGNSFHPHTVVQNGRFGWWEASNWKAKQIKGQRHSVDSYVCPKYNEVVVAVAKSIGEVMVRVFS